MNDHSPSRAIEQARTPLPLGSIAAGEWRLVLDTNVVLDWLVFADRNVQGLSEAVESQRVLWWASTAMRTELAHMLAHRDLAAWAPDAAAALSSFDRLAHVVAGGDLATLPALRCRDPDDQGFIDLAVACRARWLVTRDRALLALARPARAHGVEILPPALWALPQHP